MWVGFLAAQMAAAPVTQPVPIDILSWFSPDSYPAEAEKKHIQGTVGFAVDVDAGGKPTACRVTSSSGSPILDQATCGLVETKGHFKPAIDANGNAVPGHYASKTSWRLSDESEDSWHADIVDLTDAAHPSCTSMSNGNSAGSPGCAMLLNQPEISVLGRQAKQLVYFISVAQGGGQPYAGDPAWGTPISNAISNTYSLNGVSECVPISFEPGHNPCDRFVSERKLSEDERKLAHKTTVQETLFALPRGQ